MKIKLFNLNVVKRINPIKFSLNFRIIFFTAFLFFYLFTFVSKVSANTVIFEDNFDDGNADGWLVISGNWLTQNQKYGTRIGTQFTLAETQIGDYSWTNYEFEVDLTVIAGEDRNLFFRSNPERSIYGDQAWNWPRGYGLHITPGTTYLIKFLPTSALYVAFAGFSFPTGTTHKMKMSVLDRRIRIYGDNNLLIDFTDSSQDAFLSGRIALAASTGTVYPTEVWYDNVVVTSLDATLTPTPTLTPSLTPTPTPTPPTPVVFLPGLGASFNFPEMFLGIFNPNGWTMTPGAKVYDNIIKTFENYPSFYVFNYNWKKSALESAVDLNNFIKNTVQPLNKVYLVGHSLGGLVARTCIQKTDNACFAEKLITVGSPHSGVVQIYPVVEAGEVWGANIVDIFMKILIHYHQRPFETPRETALRIAPISLELLPTFDYLKRNGSFVPWASLSVINPLLPQLNDLTLLNNITTTLFGYGFPTYGSIDVVDRSFWDKVLGNWADGKPVNKYNENGDGTVLIQSAIINSPFINKPFLNFDHSQIISDKLGLQKIFEILNIPFPNINFNQTSDEKDYLIFFAHSPVELSSPDINNESFTNPEMIIIPKPESKNYTLKIKGLSDGKYSLSVGQIYGENTQWSDYFNNIKLGEIQNLIFSINPQTPLIPPNPIIDPKGVNTKNFVKSIIDDLKNEINNLSLDKDRKNLLLASIVLIKPDKPEESLTLLGLFRNTVALYEKGALISTEGANFFRNRSSQLSGFLETLAFLSPKVTKSNVAQNGLSLAQKSKNSVKINNLTKNSAQVYLEAEEKYKKAMDNFAKKDYYKTKVFAIEASSLYSESKSIK